MHADGTATEIGFSPLSKATNKGERPLRNVVDREICFSYSKHTCSVSVVGVL